MIIIKYLIKNVAKSQIAILFILLLIFFCQKLVRILGAAVDGNVPANVVLSLLSLGVPEMAQLILPLSLFLALLMAFGKLYSESEITVMHACGLHRSGLVKAAMWLALITGALALINSMWVVPWSSRHQDELLANARANPGMAALAQGQFQQARHGNAVLFIGKVRANAFSDIFLAQLHPTNNARPSVIVADQGVLTARKDGALLVELNQGTRFEGTALLRDFRITDFRHYQAIIGQQPVLRNNSEAEQQPVSALWRNPSVEARAELHWRITLVLSVFIMALLVVPLSVVNPRQSRTLSMLPAILLYLIFFLLQTSLRSDGAKGRIDPALWIWLVNVAYLALALVLNSWDSVTMRRLRRRFFLRRRLIHAGI